MAILMYWHCNLLASANDLMAHFNSFFFFLSFSFFSLYGLDKGSFPAPPPPPPGKGHLALFLVREYSGGYLEAGV